MPRKSLADLKVDPRLEFFIAKVNVEHEAAVDVYKAQDKETKLCLDGAAALFRNYMTGELEGGTPVPEDILMKQAQVLAVETFKDLAFTGIQVANFVFPDKLCAGCGDLLG